MQGGQVTLLHADCDSTLDRLVQLIPTAMSEIRTAIDDVRKQQAAPKPEAEQPQEEGASEAKAE